MHNHHLLATALVLSALGACTQTPEQVGSTDDDITSTLDLWQQADLRFDPLPTDASAPDNPITTAKVELGKKLYHDRRLSKKGNTSCSSCHDLAHFGVDNLATSPGDDGVLGERNSPTVLNAAFHLSQFWDGRAEDLEQQAGMPILDPDEMAIPSEAFLVDRLAGVEEYRRLFAEAFPDEADPLTYLNIRKALAAFERTLLTPSRFDAYLAGDRSALTEEEQSGLRRFIELGCTTCHNGINVGAHSFQKFGLKADYWEHTHSEKIDPGRFALTNNPEERYVFRVASLRNVGGTAPYFHDGSVATLEEAIAIMVRVQLDMEISDREVADLAAFLRSLSGEVPREALPSAS